jgi:nucleoside-diphosphate-sugar epimerase
MPKTVLITGSSGFIGSRIAASFVQDDYKVVGIDMKIIPHLNYEQKECNLLEEDLAQYISECQPDIIIHCAGNASVGLSVKEPFMDFSNNVQLLHKLFFTLLKVGCKPKVIFLSSAAVYGNPGKLPISESDSLMPMSPYGLHKRLCENICEYFYNVENIPVTIVRIFSAYGAGIRKQLFWELATKIAKKEKLELYGTGEETRDFIHITDVIQAIRLIADKSDKLIYNIANGCETTIREAAGILVTEMGKDIRDLNFNGIIKDGDPINWRADITALETLGYTAKVNLKEGIASYARWVNEYGN